MNGRRSTTLLVATDIDGTLIPRGRTTSSGNIAALERLRDLGALVVLVTGRAPAAVPAALRALPGVAFVICANGAVTIDTTGRTVRQSPLTGADLRATIGALRKLPIRMSVAVERDGVLVRDTTYPDVTAGLRPTTIATDEELWAQPAVKLLIRVAPADTELVERVARSRTNPTSSGLPGLVECSAPGVDKATGLAATVALTGRDLAGTIAFGDMPNDAPMLAWADTGVAMADAHPSLLAVADHIAPRADQDGFASAVGWWLSRQDDPVSTQGVGT